MEGFKKLEDNSIDLCVTSPPYNCGIDYDSWDDNKSLEDYLQWCRGWMTEMKRVLKPDGRFAINHLTAMMTKDGTRVSPQIELYNILVDVGLKMNSQALWTDRTLPSLTAWGSWKSASAPYISSPYEVILIGYKDTWKKEQSGINTISKEDFMMGVCGLWNIKPETRGLTKANFPVELPKLCIELLSFQDDVVLDPFMGSGTTAVACVRTKRNYVGFEISPNYHKIAEDRVAKETLFY